MKCAAKRTERPLPRNAEHSRRPSRCVSGSSSPALKMIIEVVAMRKKIALGGLMMVATMVLAEPAMAQELSSSGVMNDVLKRFHDAAATWGPAIESAASRLFWTLVVISMVWTFGMMALRKADIGEFFAEFVKFTIFTGFFWWLLTNGPNFGKSIMDGLRQVGSNATGLTSALSPSGIVDIGFAIFNKVLAASSMWSPVDSAIGIILAAIVLVILALVGVSMLLLLVSGWILAYAGVFFLGFGGARWTSDMAINYYKTVLGIAAQLFTMVLLVGIGKTFLDDYYSRMSAGVEFSEMGVMLIVSVVLLMLVNKVPALISGIITGASVGHAGIGNFGAGAAVGAAGMAAAAAATGGAMLAASAANAAGGAQALTAAFSKASENVQSGSDVLTSMWAGGSGGGKSEENMGITPFSQAAGFASSGASSAAKTGWQGGNAKGKHQEKLDQGQGKMGESKDGAGSGRTPTAEGGQQQSSGGLMSSVGKAGLIAADTAANLVKGTAQVAKEAMAGTKEAAMDRIADTSGGRIAAAIKAGNAPEGMGATVESAPTFEGNNLAGAGTGDADEAAEVAAFANRDSRFVSARTA